METFAAEGTSTSERFPQATKTEGVESMQTHADSITPGDGRNRSGNIAKLNL